MKLNQVFLKRSKQIILDHLQLELPAQGVVVLLGANGAGVNLGLCTPADAPIGNVPLTDGAPVSAADFNSSFPYLLRPYAGSPNNAAIPTPSNW